MTEVRSPSDRSSVIRKKMNTWLANGAELAWLIDPEDRTVELYRRGQEPELLQNPVAVHGDGPVTGFVLTMSKVWG